MIANYNVGDDYLEIMFYHPSTVDEAHEMYCMLIHARELIGKPWNEFRNMNTYRSYTWKFEQEA